MKNPKYALYLLYTLVFILAIIFGYAIYRDCQTPKKNCAGNVWNVEIYYSDELGLWVGEFDTFIGKKPVHAIAGSSKDRETLEKAINRYCR